MKIMNMISEYRLELKRDQQIASGLRIKLLEHAMKVVERIFEHRIWQQTDIDDMQF